MMKKSILLFDEEVLLSKEIKEGFELRDPEIEMKSATTYAEAFDLLTNNQFEAIVIDVVVPFTERDRTINAKLLNNLNTGITFKEHVLELVHAGTIKGKPRLYLFTARTDLTLEDTAGVDGVILKPKRPSEIFKKVMGI